MKKGKGEKINLNNSSKMILRRIYKQVNHFKWEKVKKMMAVEKMKITWKKPMVHNWVMPMMSFISYLTLLMAPKEVKLERREERASLPPFLIFA